MSVEYLARRTVDHTPSVLSSAHLLAIDDDALLRSDDGEGNDVLDLCVESPLLLVEFVVVVRVHLQVVERKLLLDAFLERRALLHREGVGLGDDGDDIDHVAELLQNDDVDGLETVLHAC
jgi:hypothetical protein